MNLAIPEALKPYAGRITDIDSHEHMPAQLWIEAFGEVARPIMEMTMEQQARNKNSSNVPGYVGDTAEISPQSLWFNKGPTAPGAVDLERRIEVMDMMAIDRQLLFPTSIGLWASVLYGAPKDGPLFKKFGAGTYDLAKRLFDAYAEWAVGVARDKRRIVPVAGIYGDTPEELTAMARRQIDRGFGAILMSSGRMPGDVSPAANALDPLYALLAEAKVPLNFHIGGELLFLGSSRWGQAEAFSGYKVSEETSLDPWRLSVLHLAPQNFVATMVTGGVFDRHPTLRVGVQEYTAHWIGPLARFLDLWHNNNHSIHDKQFSQGHSGKQLPMLPSEYINRNIRVSPFDFEPVDEYIEMYGLTDTYCFASDYPHVEGGKNPMGRFSSALERLGPATMEKFFVENGTWLLPVRSAAH